MDFDFNDLAPSNEPVWFTLTNPATGQDAMRGGKPVRIAILGPDTPKMVAFEQRIADGRLQQAGRTGRINITAATVEEEATEKAVASIVGWENFGLAGDDLPYSEAAARELVQKYRWLRDFWQEKFNSRGNFLGTAETSPPS